MQQENKGVMDTNIIISAAISVDGAPAKIFELFLENKIVNHLSEDIFDEVVRVFGRPYFQRAISGDFVDFILKSLKDKSVMIRPRFDVNISSHQADNKFLNCALTAKANIISGDKHLLHVNKYKDIKIYSARQFLDKKE